MAETKMQLADWLDDLCVRFIINLPQEELESVERICFQVEEAQWFYEDFIRPLDAALPSLPLRSFSLQMFRHCPLLASFSEYHHLAAFDEFLAYKTRVPVRGAIMLNHAMDQVLLVRGWKKGANWSFPRGKINKDEKDLDCAIREVYEETGYDILAAGLVPDPSKAKYIEVTMREQHMKLYVFRGVSQDTVFQPRTRKEISKIEWYKLSQLPGYHKAKHNNPGTDHEDTLKANRFYMVAPFLQPLKKWIAQQRKMENRHTRVSSQFEAVPVSDAADYYDTEDNDMHRHLQYAQKVYDAYADQAVNQPSQLLQQPALNPDPVAPISGADATSQLKRLLSVGQQPLVQEDSLPEAGSAANLFSMLRQSGSRAAAAQQVWPTTQEIHNRNVFDQSLPGVSHSQHPQYQRLPEMSVDNTFQPNLSYEPMPTNEPSQQQMPMSYDRRFMDATNNFAPIQARRPSRQPTTALQQSMERQNQDSTQQAPAPYQRTGDPHFARETHMLSQQGPAIPAASDLPAPKLSNHALNLLNTFKGSSPALSGPSQAPAQRPTIAEVSAMQTSGQSQVNQTGHSISKPVRHQHSESRSRQVLSQAFSPLNLQEPESFQQPIEPPANTSKGQQSSQQNALLDLFRKPSQPPAETGHGAFSTNRTLSELLQGGKSGQQPPAQVDSESIRVENQQANYLVPDPVELSAMPSPGLTPQRKQLFDPKDGTMKEHVPQPRVLTRPSSSHKPARDASSSPLVSATMSGPPNVPEFGTVRRKPRQSKQSMDQTENVFREQEPARSIQILRRPASPKEPSPATEVKAEPKSAAELENRRPATPSAPKPARTPTTPAELKGSTPKPFQPQILRRPHQSPAAPAALQLQQSAASPKLKSEPRSSDLSSPLLASGQSPQPPVAHLRPVTRASRNAHGPAQPTDSMLERRSSNTVEQKQTLLSLFAKPKTPASAAAAAVAPPPQPINSHPASAISTPLTAPTVPSAAAASLTRIAQGSPISASTFDTTAAAATAAAAGAGPLRSSFSSVSAVSAVDATLSPGSGHGQSSGPASVAAPEDAKLSRTGSASQTPMSAGDRGFLLSFLEGFAKGPAGAVQPRPQSQSQARR